MTNRHYLGGTETATFGTGLSWWFPEHAFAFVEQKRLPAEVFHSYNTGGFVTWRLGPKYRDYLDGRAIPFGPVHLRKAGSTDVDLARFGGVACERSTTIKLNTVVLSLARYDGAAAALPGFCNSVLWAPVYLDEISAVFVRRSPSTRAIVDSHGLDCATATILATAQVPIPRWRSINGRTPRSSCTYSAVKRKRCRRASVRCRSFPTAPTFISYAPGF